MYFCQWPILEVKITLMIQGLSTSHSGLRFAQERLRSTAHNTANSTTEVVPKAGRHRVEEAVEMIAASQHFATAVRVVQNQDEMLGALLDREG